MTNEVRITATLNDKVTGAVGKMTDKFDTLGKSKGFQSVVQGVGLGVGLDAYSALRKGVDFFTDAVFDSIKAAREDAVSQQKLASALRENVPAWDGNKDAIERVLKARMKLGYSDDAQRESLATIVRTTHDVNKALFLEAGAMDIARARNVDLATASDAVAKAASGNSKALKSLIPGLKLGATAAETLSNAFASVKGSAEDYAKTDEGRVVVAQVKVNESMETFGYKILPFVTDRMVDAADVVSGLASGMELLSASTKHTTEENKDLAHSFAEGLLPLGPFANWLGSTSLNLMNFGQEWKTSAAMVASESGTMSDAAYKAMNSIGGSLDGAGTDVVDFRDKYKDAAGEVSRASHRMTTQLVKDAARIRGEVFDETEIRADLHAMRMELHDAEVARSHAKTKEAMRQASDDIVQSLDDEGQGLEDLADQGKLTKKDVDRFAADVKKNYALLSKDGRHQIDLLLERYRLLANQKNINKTFTLNYKTKGTPSGTGTGTHAGGSGPQEFAKGGVVKGPLGSPQEAIVHAGETVRTPEQERALHRSSVGAAGAVMAGSGITVIVNAGIGTSFTAAEGRRLADAILPPLVAAMQRTGQLPRTGTGLRG